jgi:hypothetical protein
MPTDCTQIARKTFNNDSSTAIGYAYETIPNKPIVTGQTKGPDVVEPATLGHLARGAARKLAACGAVSLTLTPFTE